MFCFEKKYQPLKTEQQQLPVQNQKACSSSLRGASSNNPKVLRLNVGPKKLGPPHHQAKLYIPWCYKYLVYVVAHTMLGLARSILINHSLNHGLPHSLFKVFGWKYILNWIEHSGLRSRILYCLRFGVFTWCTSLSASNQPISTYLPKWQCSSVYSTWDV